MTHWQDLFSEPLTISFRDDFATITGPSPRFEVALKDNDSPFAHKAAAYLSDTDAIIVTSAWHSTDATDDAVSIEVEDGSKVTKSISHCQRHNGDSWTRSSTTRPEIDNTPCVLNEGIEYRGGALFSYQTLGGHNGASGLMMTSSDPYKNEKLVDSFNGRPFASVRHVAVHADGSMWFTDSAAPDGPDPGNGVDLPSQIYRFDPVTGDIRAMADGFETPAALCFDFHQSTLYVSDIGRVRPSDTVDGNQILKHTGPSTIYAFDVALRHGSPFLMNRRLFAFTEAGIPETVKCDTTGNVYAGCGDGVNVWNPGGVLLGKFMVPGGVSDFKFGKAGEMFILNRNRLIVLTIDKNVVGV